MSIFDRRRNMAGRNADFDLVAGNAGPINDLLTPSAATKTLYIVRIVVAVITYSAKTITFLDDASSAKTIGFLSIPAASGTTPNENTYMISFGEKGTPLTLGKNLDVNLSGAGVAARIHVEAYEK